MGLRNFLKKGAWNKLKRKIEYRPRNKNEVIIFECRRGIPPNSNEIQTERKRDFNKCANGTAGGDFPLKYFRRYFFVDLESNSDARYCSINIFVRRHSYFPGLPMHRWSFIVINDVYETHDAVRLKFPGYRE